MKIASEFRKRIAKARVVAGLIDGKILFIAMLLLGSGSKTLTPATSKPLWPGAQYTEQDRDVAVERGLEFIYKIALDRKYFSIWGSDLLSCVYTISATAKNERLREKARRMGEERAREWRREHADAPGDDPLDLRLFAHGAAAADGLLGASDPDLKRRVQEAAQRLSAIDFLGFDPHQELPPSDIPEPCPKCQHRNPRGATVCQKCQTALTFRSPYDVWLDALITTYQGENYGVTLGASYPDVLRQVSRMRPYPAPTDNEDQFDDVSYAVTHVIYTLNKYHKYRLSPAWLPQEFDYLKSNIRTAERYENWELLGEFADALRAFGEDESDPEIQVAVSYLLSHQNPDGSWGDVDDNDIYTRYHSTRTAIDGLRQYSFQGEKLRFPEMLPLLQGKMVAGKGTRAEKKVR